MADLIAQGSQPDQRWRRTLQLGSEVTIGRTGATWEVDWDDRISRVHASVRCGDGDRVIVERLEAARNPIFFRGVRRDQFTLSPGEHFVIGRTTFTLAVRPQVTDSSETDPGVTQHFYPAGMLRGRGFRDAAGRIEVLSRLPELITSSVNESELLVRVAGVMMQATPAASAVAVLRCEGLRYEGLRGSSEEAIEVLHYDCRFPLGQPPRPSASLARRALQTRESVLHLWGGSSAMMPSDFIELEGGRAAYTASENVDWAFAVPLPANSGKNWVLYVTGQQQAELRGSHQQSMANAAEHLQDDLKFVELVAMTLGNLQQVRALQQRQAGLSRFFAPVVMEALAGRDPVEVLQPREAEITTLFCDLRGFSRRSEEQAEQLMELLQRVSEALGVMTRNILQQDGVIGDFHGDAAMGFWGWPLQQEDAPARACQTALAILNDFRARSADGDGPLEGFRCGIGIASGRAVAGRIGTIDQVKVTAFGPVVNLASRLEGMTKVFSAEILVDEATAIAIGQQLSPSVARVRRLARVRPAGVRTPLMVHQVLPPAGSEGALSDSAIALYEEALDEVLAGRWERGFRLLHEVPAGDRVKDFLTVFIASHGRVPPDQWDGVIALTNK